MNYLLITKETLGAVGLTTRADLCSVDGTEAVYECDSRYRTNIRQLLQTD